MKRLALFVSAWALAAGGAVFGSGCYGHNCDGDAQIWGVNAGEGHMVDDTTWESTPTEDKWLAFPRQRFWHFDMRVIGNRRPYAIIPYVSASEQPFGSSDGKIAPSNFTVGGGNLTEINSVDKDHFDVHNGTCADYFLRVVVLVSPQPPELDAGADGGPL